MADRLPPSRRCGLRSLAAAVAIAALGLAAGGAAEVAAPTTEVAAPTGDLASAHEPDGRPTVAMPPIAPKLFAGARELTRQPERLRAAGVTLVLSVDGEPSDASVEAAGITRLHVPIGYAGPTPKQTAALSRVFDRWRRDGGGLLVHCHHGRHRGPAVAAMLAGWADELTPAERRAALHRCGTGPQYVGLWDSVTISRPPASDVPVPAVAAAGPLAAAMRLLDEAVAADGDDQAVLLDEALLEVDRARRRQPIDDALWNATVAMLRSSKRDAASVEASCVACHTQRRGR